VVATLERILARGSHAEHACEIARDGRLLGDYELHRSMIRGEADSAIGATLRA